MKSIRLSGFDYSAANRAYFVTAKYKLTLLETVRGELCRVLFRLVRDSSYTCDALVVMPDHVHLLVHASDANNQRLSELICVLKSKSVYLIKKSGIIQESFWRRGYYEHVIRGREDFEEKLRYIVNNPIKAGLVEGNEPCRYLYVAALNVGRHKAAPYAEETIPVYNKIQYHGLNRPQRRNDEQEY